MAAATNSIDINRPVEQVYRFLANGLNNPQWRPAVTDIKLASGSPGTFGAVYEQRIKGPFGIRIPADLGKECNRCTCFLVDRRTDRHELGLSPAFHFALAIRSATPVMAIPAHLKYFSSATAQGQRV